MRSAVRSGERLGPTTPAAVVWLGQGPARDPALTGAKASALTVAAAVGMPVLPGFVLTTAYDHASSAHREEAFGAWAQLSRGGELSLAVRSSSTIEDGATTSMAGLFTSVLDVRGWGPFQEAVGTVLSSANVVPLVDGGGNAPMAVLVQPYLRAVSGGVTASRPPSARCPTSTRERLAFHPVRMN